MRDKRTADEKAVDDADQYVSLWDFHDYPEGSGQDKPDDLGLWFYRHAGGEPEPELISSTDQLEYFRGCNGRWFGPYPLPWESA